MKPSQRLLTLALVALIAASCGGGAGDGGADSLPAEARPVVQYQSAAGELRLGTLQLGQNIYPDVTLRLAPDGTWAMESVGTMRPLRLDESPQAVLQAPEGTALYPGWRPTVATITVRRMHIGAKVYGSVPLQLAGATWFWGHALQAGNDTGDLHELKALTLADFRANPALAASETHHTVLRSSPEHRTQVFPMQLKARRYRFCMGPQEDGADSLRVLNATGAAVVSLHAGQPCVEVSLEPGTYSMEHQYGGSGARRTVFVGGATAPAVAPRRPAASLVGDAAYREYWAVSVPPAASHGGGFLSFNEVVDEQWYCKGFIDAAAQLTTYGRPGLTGWDRLFASTNFFQVTRDGAGVPTAFGYPYFCRANWVTRPGHSYWASPIGSGGAPLLISPTSYGMQESFDWLQILGYAAGQFQLGHRYYACEIPNQPGCWAISTMGFRSGSVMRGMTQADLVQLMGNDSDPSFNGLRADLAGDYQVAFRFFPEGFEPSMRDATGLWTLDQGEVALFAEAGCTGAVMVARHAGVLSTQFDGNTIGSFNGSVQLGPNAVAKASRGGVARVINQSGCLDGVIDLALDSMELETTTEINVRTNSCEYCNLAGIDLSNEPDALVNVRLQHANLADSSFANSDLSGSDLRFASLQGANLSNANLEAANLCNASLNGRELPDGTSGMAAQLPGAHLKNASLAGAQLDGANFTQASFYSSSAGACLPSDCATYSVPSCATASGATANNATFVGSYLANAGMDGIAANGADFSSAVLFGARLVNAKLSRSTSTGRSVSFGAALLHGADFSNAAADHASFKGASADADPANNCMQVNLSSDYLSFPGFTVPKERSCAAPASVPAQSCVKATYGARVGPVATNATNICPNGNKGPCSQESWGKVARNSSTCTGTAPLCGNPFVGSNENTCWNK